MSTSTRSSRASVSAVARSWRRLIRRSPTMPELERLFTEFVERHLAGEDPDPWSYIEQLSGEKREELEELIDAYFVDAPPRAWDATAYKGSSAERIAEALDRSFRGRAGLWPAVLPRLRDRV